MDKKKHIYFCLGLALHGNMTVGSESKVPPLCVCVYSQPIGFEAQRRRSWEVADTDLPYTSVHWFLGGARRTESVVPRSQLE